MMKKFVNNYENINEVLAKVLLVVMTIMIGIAIVVGNGLLVCVAIIGLPFLYMIYWMISKCIILMYYNYLYKNEVED